MNPQATDKDLSNQASHVVENTGEVSGIGQNDPNLGHPAANAVGGPQFTVDRFPGGPLTYREYN
jgi:hypothetical protein